MKKTEKKLGRAWIISSVYQFKQLKTETAQPDLKKQPKIDSDIEPPIVVVEDIGSHFLNFSANFSKCSKHNDLINDRKYGLFFSFCTLNILFLFVFLKERNI